MLTPSLRCACLSLLCTLHEISPAPKLLGGLPILFCSFECFACALASNLPPTLPSLSLSPCLSLLPTFSVSMWMFSFDAPAVSHCYEHALINRSFARLQFRPLRILYCFACRSYGRLSVSVCACAFVKNPKTFGAPLSSCLRLHTRKASSSFEGDVYLSNQNNFLTLHKIL